MRFKWEAVVAMVLLILLGFWLIYQPSESLYSERFRDGATAVEYRIGGGRGWVEIVSDEQGVRTYRMVPRMGEPTQVLHDDQIKMLLGADLYETVTTQEQSFLFRIFNITGWGSLAWVLLGFGAQVVFAGRFMVQWIVSEREKKSTVPNAFWWMSLIGGLLLFVYFVWRQDPVGVFGQSSGIVIYARNLRLIGKEKRRLAADELDEAGGSGES